MEITKQQPPLQEPGREKEQEGNGDVILPYCGFLPVQRRFIIGIVSAAGLVGPLAGGIYLPALPVLQQEFDVDSTAINATVSVFMALCAFAPLFWSAFADWKGRKPLYIISLAIYLVANVLMAALPANFGALVFLRMVQAFGCSSVISLGAGAVADVRILYFYITSDHPSDRLLTYPWTGNRASPQRIRYVYLPAGAKSRTDPWPCTGRCYYGADIVEMDVWCLRYASSDFVIEKKTATDQESSLTIAIIVGVIWLLIIFVFPETLRSRVGNGRLYANTGFILWPPRLTSLLAPESERGPAPPKPSVAAFWRLFCYPPISISSVYTAILFANYFSIAVDLPVVLTDEYRWSITAVGGGYLALGVAIVMGSLFAGRFSDWRRARMVKASDDDNVEPESRLVDQIWGTVLCAAGSIMYGWFVERNIHPAAVLVATFLGT